jgi:hypothetical protein
LTIARRLVPAAAPVPSDTRGSRDCNYHDCDCSCGHDPSMWNTPQLAHSNVKSSDNPPKRGVLRTSRINCAQCGQRGGRGAGRFALSSDTSMLRATNCIIVEAFSTPGPLRSQSIKGGRCNAPSQADIDAESLLRSG